MLKYIKNLLRQEGLTISIYVTLFIIFSNTVFTFYYRNLIITNREIKEQVLAVNHHIEFMNKYVNLADLGLRGYIIDQDDKFLTPYIEAIEAYQNNFDELEILLDDQGFDVSKMAPAVKAVGVYMNLVKSMVDMCRIGEVEKAVEILKKDPGYDAWKIYAVFEREALAFETALSDHTNEIYNQMIFRMVAAQLLLMIIGLPILIFAVSTIKKTKKKQKEIYADLSESNKKYLFNPGKESEYEEDEKGIIQSLITNLKKTASFINNITTGNYSISWDGLTDENAQLNKGNIAGELTSMRDQMKKVKEEDEIRIWTSQGLSNFAEIVRSNQDNFKELAEKLIVNLVKYLDVQQGGIFIVNAENEDDIYLELMGCYAYDRVKTVDKRIETGQGLVGQCYLEKETILMTQVPQDYISITSGLGDTRPDCILIVPLKLNDNIEGVIELASLKKFETHKITFVEKLGETIASAITTVRTAETTKLLLEQSQQQGEEMRAQEEEMRQNMEELQATQEQMERKNEEIETLLQKASQNEVEMQKQQDIILLEKKQLETEKSILTTLLEVIPDRITVKDKEGKYLKVSNSKIKTLKEQGHKNVIGISDKEMYGAEYFEKSYSTEKEIMNTQKSILNIEEQIEISQGNKIWGRTSRVPLKDNEGHVLGTLSVTRDITKEKTCIEELEDLKKEKNN